MPSVLYNIPHATFPLQWDLDHCVNSAIENDALSSVLFILPTNRMIRHWKRRVIQQYFSLHHRAIESLPFLTLEQFAGHIVQRLSNCPDLRRISRAYQIVLLQQAIRTAAPRYYTVDRTIRSPAVLERLFQIIQGLKEDGITPHHLSNQLRDPQQHHILSPHRLADIQEIYTAYQELLDNTLLDPPEQLQRAIELLRGERDPDTLERRLIPDIDLQSLQKRWRIVLPNVETIIFAGFSDFKSPEQELLELLCKAPFHVRLILDFSAENGPLFGKFQSIIEQLQNRGFQRYESDVPPPDREPSQWPLPHYLRRWLFNTERAIHHPGFSPMFTIYRVEDRIEEVHLLAKLIRYIADTEAVPYETMAIVCRIPETYADLFREIFPLYQIPINVTAQFFLRQSPVITAIFSILDLILEGFRRSDLHRTLTNPYIRPTLSSNIDPNTFYTVALRYRLVGGHQHRGLSGWLFHLRHRLNLLQNYFNDLKTKPYADPDALHQLKRDIQQLHQAIETIEQLHNLDFPVSPTQQMTALTFVSFIRDQILKRFQIQTIITKFYHHLSKLPSSANRETLSLIEEAEKDARALTRFLEILEEMLFIEYDIFDLPQRPFEEFVFQLRSAVEHSRYQIREKPGYGVTITSLSEIRGIPYQCLFLCGAIEKELPLQYVPEVFLGQELPEAEEHHLQQERMLFYQALTNNPSALVNGSFRFVITYPSVQESQQLVRSSFIDALLKISTLEHDGKVYDLPELRKQRLYPDQKEYAQSRLDQLDFLSIQTAPSEILSTIGILETEAPHLSVSIRQTLPENLRFAADAVADFVRHYPKFQQQRKIVTLAPGARETLQRLLTKPLSVSMLEQFLRCPYQFFAERILQLQPIERPTTELTPLEQGLLLHTILFRFFAELRTQKRQPEGTPIQLSSKQRAQYEALLTSLAESELQRLQFDHPFFELDRRLLLGTAERKGILHQWLDNELQLIDHYHYQFHPAFFELAFGRPDASSFPPIAINSKLILQGKIDRIDIRHEGDKLKFLLVDYKTTQRSVPSPSQIRQGKSLQMPLYLLAAQHLLEQHFQKAVEPVSALYIVLTPSKPAEKADVTSSYHFVFASDDIPDFASNRLPDWESTIKRVLHSVHTIIDQIQAGHFPVTPQPDACRTCSFVSLCRINDFPQWNNAAGNKP